MLLLVRLAKRLFTRQRFSPPRLSLRLGVIGVACAALVGSVSVARGPAPVAAGLAVGAAAGLIGLAYTRFERVEGALYYKPNLYSGLAGHGGSCLRAARVLPLLHGGGAVAWPVVGADLGRRRRSRCCPALTLVGAHAPVPRQS